MIINLQAEICYLLSQEPRYTDKYKHLSKLHERLTKYEKRRRK